MTDIAHYEPDSTGSMPVIIGGQLEAFVGFAKHLATSSLLPNDLRGKPADVFMALMEGLDLGLRPMQALNLIDVIKGKPCLKAEGKRALLLANGHEFRVTEWTDEKCVVEGRRRGTEEWRSAEFTAEQAKRAGLSGDNWTKYRADMLLARATSRLCKAYFADVTNGLGTSEELWDAEPVARPSLAAVAAERATPPDGVTLEGEVVDDDALRREVMAAEAEHLGDGTPAEALPVEWPTVAQPGSGGRR